MDEATAIKVAAIRRACRESPEAVERGRQQRSEYRWNAFWGREYPESSTYATAAELRKASRDRGF